MRAKMDVDLKRRQEALQRWVETCRMAMTMRWPAIKFEADAWPLKTLYGTRLLDVYFERIGEMFIEQDESFLLTFRCLMAEMAMAAKVKTWKSAYEGWCVLKGLGRPLATLTRHDLLRIEDNTVRAATPSTGLRAAAKLSILSRMLETAASKGVIAPVPWSPSQESRAKLKALEVQRGKLFKQRKSIDVLDRKIEAFSDVTAAMLQKDPRLTENERSAIASINMLMCAPARINEPLCMQTTSRIQIENYSERPRQSTTGDLFQAHQLLLMKGSKGADWSPKPVLSFMVKLADACWEVIIKNGQRSRMLLKHYENSPDRLFLPPDLEHLRGNPLERASMWQIVNLTSRTPSKKEVAGICARGVWDQLTKPHDGRAPVSPIKVANPRTHDVMGRPNTRKKIEVLPWSVAESLLLKKVRDRMAAMRRVTTTITYEGRLSEMLMLVDSPYSPYLPDAWSDASLRAHLKTTPNRAKAGKCRSVFVKLGLKMEADGQLVDCGLDPHDTRRWLTTHALNSPERLSDVLINKWAGRLNLNQMSAYDLRNDDQKAEQSGMPVPHVLESMSKSITELQELTHAKGLNTHFLAAHGDGLAVTDMQSMRKFTEEMPVARNGSEIIILTPTWFGVCFHQHAEMPCRSYKNCDRCSKQATCKGFLPTDEAWRTRASQTNQLICSELERHITEHNRGIADDTGAFEAHLLGQLNGLDASSMTRELIDQFQEIKGRIRDPNFKRRLEQAYVAHTVVQLLDDPKIPSGALIAYHNPDMHEAPGHERAMEARLGPPKVREQKLHAFHEKHPELAPSALSPKDERAFFLGSDDEGKSSYDPFETIGDGENE